MKFKDLKIGDKFHWRVGDSLLEKISTTGWKVVGTDNVYKANSCLELNTKSPNEAKILFQKMMDKLEQKRITTASPEIEAKIEKRKVLWEKIASQNSTPIKLPDGYEIEFNDSACEKCHKLTNTIAGTFILPKPAKKNYTFEVVENYTPQLTVDDGVSSEIQYVYNFLGQEIQKRKDISLKQIQRTIREFPVCKFSDQSLELKNDGTNIYWRCSHCEQKNNER